MGISNISKQECRLYGFDMNASNAVYYNKVPRGEFRPWRITPETNEVW